MELTDYQKQLIDDILSKKLIDLNSFICLSHLHTLFIFLMFVYGI